MLADDMLGRAREAAAVDPAYERALAAIDADPNNRLLVAERCRPDRRLLPADLPARARPRRRWRAQIESVRVAQSERGRGTGAAMMRWAIERARERGCALVQLTTDKRRGDAHRFYRRLGFEATHEGMKLGLP